LLVSLAVLNLLTRLAATQPVCCIVDDAHLLDHASRLVLAFVARRAERGLLILLAEREQQHRTELDGVPEMRLEPLPYDDARLLLAANTPGKIDAAVIERVLIEARGNPRALVDAFDGITAVELAGGYAIPAPRAGHSVLDHGCVQRGQQLRADARRLLLTASADPTGDPPVVWRAAAALGIGTDAAEVLEAQRLLVFGPRIGFVCPRLRAAVYATASPAELREVHQAFADAIGSDVDADRRAWHLALATSGLDDAVATELERHAPTAQTRGGIAARAAFMEKAALLTPDSVPRAQRALAAAEAQHLSGAPEAAQRLLAIADIAPPDEARQALMALQRARIAFTTHRSQASPGHLLDAARRIEPHSPVLARDTYLEALVAAVFAGDLATTPTAVDVAGAARAAVAAGPAHPADLLLDGLATRVLDGPVAATGPLTAVLRAFRAAELDPAVSRWLWLGGCVAADLWDVQTWTDLSSRQADHSGADDSTTPAHVPAHLALADIHLGRFDAARARLERVDARISAAGAAPLRHSALLLAAWQGRPGVLDDLLPRARRAARHDGDGITLTAASLAEAVLHNSVGHYEQALAAASDACRSEQLALSGWALPELVEAAVRSGRHDAAGRAVVLLSERTDAAGTDWALGIQAAARALLADEKSAEPLYREAIDRLARTDIRIHLGRAQLLYGEWLRRRKRRIDARVPLRAAWELFAAIGAEAFADRAHRELLATGEKARKRSVDAGRQLTPQESQIAHLALNGLSNPEIGARLFVSPRTVEYHLHKVFAKLAISSRTELHLVLAAAPRTHHVATPRRAPAPAGATDWAPGQGFDGTDRRVMGEASLR
jgi:DNA-binding CsgD family transcriptional regulator